MEKVQLCCLRPGQMFTRTYGGHRYVVSSQPVEHDRVYCYNLDGESQGYTWWINQLVIPIDPSNLSPQEEAPSPREKVFYMCYVEGKSGPTYKHPDLGIAEKEAIRLSEKTGDSKVYLLKAVEYVQTRSKPEVSHVYLEG